MPKLRLYDPDAGRLLESEDQARQAAEWERQAAERECDELARANAALREQLAAAQAAARGATPPATSEP